MSAAHPGTIAGVIRDELGTPVEGARVYFTDAPGPIPDVAVLTGPDGRFLLGAPVGGSYTLECHADGFEPARATVTDGDDRELDLTLPAAP